MEKIPLSLLDAQYYGLIGFHAHLHFHPQSLNLIETHTWNTQSLLYPMEYYLTLILFKLSSNQEWKDIEDLHQTLPSAFLQDHLPPKSMFYGLLFKSIICFTTLNCYFLSLNTHTHTHKLW